GVGGVARALGGIGRVGDGVSDGIRAIAAALGCAGVLRIGVGVRVGAGVGVIAFAAAIAVLDARGAVASHQRHGQRAAAEETETEAHQGTGAEQRGARGAMRTAGSAAGNEAAAVVT